MNSIAADNEILDFRQFDFYPGPARPTAFVDRICSFGDQTFHAKLLRDPEEFVISALQFFGKPDVFRRFLEHGGE
jgi:hypothetical protein